ncbi:MAG: hypothetical protein IIB00_01770 [candidate division Zixibacteria bacterium]|nr:hypothetical protein [candidate division Zixibacteria bacterium]
MVISKSIKSLYRAPKFSTVALLNNSQCTRSGYSLALFTRDENSYRKILSVCVLTITIIINTALSSFGWLRSTDFYSRDFVAIGDYSRITAIASSSQLAYFASTSGIIRYEITSGEWIEPLLGFSGLYDYPIHRMAVSFDDQEVWIETDLGVFEYSRVFGRWSDIGNFPTEEIRGEYVPPEPFYLTPPGFVYLPDGFLLDDYGRRFPTDPVFKDESGYIWMGVAGYGPAMSESAGGRVNFLNFGLLQEMVRDISKIGNMIVVGGERMTEGRSGLTLMDSETGEFRYLEQGLHSEFPYADINSISHTAEFIYAGLDRGLVEIDRSSLQPIRLYTRFDGLPNDFVYATLAIGENVFVGTESGLGIIFPDSTGVKEVAARRLNFERVFCLERGGRVSRKGKMLSPKITPRHIWIGAESGAYRLELKSFKLQKLTDPELILESPIYDIEVAGPFLWFLARDGLVRVDQTNGETRSYPDFNRFFQGEALAANDQIVAIGTQSGLHIFNHRRKGYEPIVFTVADGLPSNLVRSLMMDGDYLWIGSDRGLIRFWWNNPARNDFDD